MTPKSKQKYLEAQKLSEDVGALLSELENLGRTMRMVLEDDLSDPYRFALNREIKRLDRVLRAFRKKGGTLYQNKNKT